MNPPSPPPPFFTSVLRLFNRPSNSTYILYIHWGHIPTVLSCSSRSPPLSYMKMTCPSPPPSPSTLIFPPVSMAWHGLHPASSRVQFFFLRSQLYHHLETRVRSWSSVFYSLFFLEALLAKYFLKVKSLFFLQINQKGKTKESTKTGI